MSETDNDTKHGGPRKGAGRPPKFDERMVKMKVTIPKEMKEFIGELGDDTYSVGVRRLVEHYRETAN